MELYNKDLLKKKLTNTSTQKMLRKIKGLKNLDDIKRKLKSNIFKGVNVNKLIHDHEQEGDSNC